MKRSKTTFRRRKTCMECTQNIGTENPNNYCIDCSKKLKITYIEVEN